MKHFWILAVGTLIFVVLFLMGTENTHSGTVEFEILGTGRAIQRAMQIMGCYLAFVVVIVGHRLLREQTKDTAK